MAPQGRAQKKVLGTLEDNYKKALADRQPFEQEWFTNLAFFAGNQWIQWKRSAGYQQMHVPPAPSWRARPVRNKIRTLVRKENARLTKERPQAYVLPNSISQEDIGAAGIAEKIAEAEWDILNADTRLKKAVWWATTTGTGFLKDWWSPNEKDEDGTFGNIKLDALSPWHVLVPDLSESEIEEQPWIAHVSRKEVEWINRVYGVSLDSKRTSGSAAPWQERLLRATGIDSSRTATGGLDVKEMWIRSSADFPEGGRIVWVEEDEILVFNDYSDNGPEYQHGDYPFSKVEHMESGKFYGTSFIVDLIPPQKEYNRQLGQLIENSNLTSRPQFAALEGSIDVSQWTARPGLVVTYKAAGHPPTKIDPPNVGTHIPQMLDRNVQDMGDAASQHEISRGSAPGRVEAASAISFLQEQDDSAISHTLTTIEKCVEKVGGHILSHANQFWDAQRLIRLAGQNGAMEAMQFSNTDLRGNTAYRVVKGSATPRSQAAKQAMIMQLMSDGLVPPERGLAMLELSATDMLFEEMMEDTRHADRENMIIAAMQEPEESQVMEAVLGIVGPSQGLAPENKPALASVKINVLLQFTLPINDFDDDMVHITRHELAEKRQGFQRLPKIKQEMHRAHRLAHYQAMAMKMGIQMDIADPRLIGFIKGFGAPPPESMEDAPQGELGPGDAGEGEQ